MSDTATPNGTAKPVTADDLAKHALKAQLQAVSATAAATNAMAEAALATLALLEASDPISALALRQALRPRPPQSEAEANFFGKVRDTQQTGASNGQ